MMNRVLIKFSTNALGDSLAWIPYVEEFRKKHNFEVFCSTYWSHLFKDEYREIKFIESDKVIDNLYSTYNIGWFFSDEPLKIPLQQIASNILGLDYKEIKPKISVLEKLSSIENKYVCISVQSISQCKYWNCKDGWKTVISYLKKKGYKVVCIDKWNQMGTNPLKNIVPSNIIDKTGCSIEDAIIYLRYADFFIGISSGLSWLSWAVGTPTIMISSFSKPWFEFQSNIKRVYKEHENSGFLNTVGFRTNKWDWNPIKVCKTFEDWDKYEPIRENDVIEVVEEMINES